MQEEYSQQDICNASHTMEDAEKTLAAADKAMKALKENNYNYIAK